MKKPAWVEEFVAFAVKGNAMALAVGTIIGAAFSTITKSLTDDIIMPVIAMFTGDIDCRLDATELTVEASFEKDLTLPYDRIDSLELREEGVDGSRVIGFASSRLLMGSFQNDEFGTYTRYTYTGDGPAIVIEAQGKTLVIGLKEPADTLALFEALTEKVG